MIVEHDVHQVEIANVIDARQAEIVIAALPVEIEIGIDVITIRLQATAIVDIRKRMITNVGDVTMIGTLVIIVDDFHRRDNDTTIDAIDIKEVSLSC